MSKHGPGPSMIAHAKGRGIRHHTTPGPEGMVAERRRPEPLIRGPRPGSSAPPVLGLYCDPPAGRPTPTSQRVYIPPRRALSNCHGPFGFLSRAGGEDVCSGRPSKEETYGRRDFRGSVAGEVPRISLLGRWVNSEPPRRSSQPAAPTARRPPPSVSSPPRSRGRSSERTCSDRGGASPA